MKKILALLALAIATPAPAQVIGGFAPPVATNPTISTLTTGTVLDVGGSVSADGRYVTMAIHPSVSSLDGFQTFRFTAPGGVGATQAVGVARLPFRPAQVGNVTFVDADKKLLTATIPAMTLKNLSLKQAADRIAVVAKINVVLGLRGFEQARVNVNQPQDFSLRAGPVKDAMLAVLKIAAPQTNVVITADDGVLQVATQAQADNDVVTRTYYLEDLLANMPRIVSSQTDLETLKPQAQEKEPAGKTPAATNTLPPAVGGPGTRRPGIQRAIVPTAGEPVAADARPPISTTITELIASTVRPEIWKCNGGKIGEIAVVGDRVIIKAPQSVQAILTGPTHHNSNAAPVYISTGGM